MKNMYKGLILTTMVVLFAACGPASIPGTEIDDNPTNRSIYETVEAYRIAVEKKDVKVLSRLVSKEYFETAATTGKSDDDYGYQEVLERLFPMLDENIKEVFYKFEYKRIDLIGKAASVFIKYHLKFHYIEDEIDGWKEKKDVHRLDLVWEDEMWKISGGL
jgi:hypothetical protein